MKGRYIASFSGTLPPSRGKQKSSETKPASRVSRPEKPISKPSFSVLGPKQARARSAPPPAKRISEKPVHPPFLAYGYRDKEREIGAKKTHNIRASAEVIANTQGGHGTGKTGNLVLTFSRQGKHREFSSDTGKNVLTQGKYLDCDY